MPEEWSGFVRKHDDKAASDDDDGALQWIDECGNELMAERERGW